MAKGRVSAQELRRDPLMEQYVKTHGWVKDRSRPLLTWLIVAAAVIALALIAWLIFSRRASSAAEAMARAYCWNDALVANPVPPNATGCVATTEEEKHRKAYEAFEQAARDYSSNREMGRYLAATHQVYFEPQKAAATLQELAQQNSNLGAQARLALAQHYEASSKYDDAIAEYQKLKAKPGAVPPAIIDFNIARTHEAMGKTKEAADGYFAIASTKELRSTGLGTAAANRLTVLAPERIEQLPAPEGGSPMSSLGGMGGGIPMSVR